MNLLGLLHFEETLYDPFQVYFQTPKETKQNKAIYIYGTNLREEWFRGGASGLCVGGRRLMEHTFSDGERLTGGCHLQVTSKEHRKSKTIPLFRNGRRWGAAHCGES